MAATAVRHRDLVPDQRFAPAHTLREQQSFKAIDVPDSLGDQHFALAAETATILFLGSRRLDHCAHSGFAGFPP